MAKKNYSAAEIVDLLRQAEVHLSQGMTVVEAVKQLGISEQTYYRWRKEYGGPGQNPGEKTKRARKREPGTEEAGG